MGINIRDVPGGFMVRQPYTGTVLRVTRTLDEALEFMKIEFEKENLE